MFISFPLRSFAASRPSKIGMPQLRSEAEPLGITTVKGARWPAFFGGPPGVSAPNIWGMAGMRSLLSLPDVFNSAFYACGYKEPHDESLPDARLQNFASSGFSSNMLHGIFHLLQDLSLRVGVSETFWRVSFTGVAPARSKTLGVSSKSCPSASTGTLWAGFSGLSGSSTSGNRSSGSPTSSAIAATSGVSGTLWRVSSTGVAPGRALRVHQRLLRSRRLRGSQGLHGEEVPRGLLRLARKL